MSIGHESAFDLIAQEVVESNSSLSRIYKGFIKPDLYYLKPMLIILEREGDIDPKLAESVMQIISGNVEAVVSFIVDHYLRKLKGVADEISLAKT